MKVKFKLLVDVVLLVSFVSTVVSLCMGRLGKEVHVLAGSIMIISGIVHFILNWKMFLGLGKAAFSKAEQPTETTKG